MLFRRQKSRLIDFDASSLNKLSNLFKEFKSNGSYFKLASARSIFSSINDPLDSTFSTYFFSSETKSK